MKKVSVIIPYNKDRGYLSAAIDSVKQQTYKNIELILSQSEGSGAFNLMRGVEQATGDYIKWLGEDDILLENCITDSVNFIEPYDFIHAKGFNYYPDRVEPYKLTNPDSTLESMLIQNGINGGTVFYKRSVFDKFSFDEDLWTAGEYDFHLKLLFNGLKLGYLDKFVYLYRRHSEQKSLGNRNSEYQSRRNEVVKEIRLRYDPSNRINT